MTSSDAHPAVGGPQAWTAASLDPNWERSLTDGEITAIETALGVFRGASPELDLRHMTRDTFPLDGIAPQIAALRERLVEGQGVAAFHGFPTDGYSVAELRAIWFGLALHIGTPVAQSHRGDLLGDVRDIGTGISGKTGRGYTSNAELNFHSDTADASGLFFLRQAREGGTSRVASSVAVHDLLAEHHPELLGALYEPLPVSWQGNQPPGEQAWYPMPVFGRVDDQISCAFVRTNIVLAERNAGAPPLTDLQRRAIDAVVETASAPEMWVERRFEPGTMLFVHNHTVFHLRSAFVDWDEPERKRHLLRVWLSLPNSRRLPDSFGTFFAATAAGAVRGGYRSRATEPVFETV